MKSILPYFLLLTLLCGICKAQSNLPRLSPKPFKVEGVEQCYISLDGKWNFHTESIKNSEIEVPGEWTMQGFDVPEGETAVYSRTFILPDGWPGKRIKIRFDAVSSNAVVKINGKKVGEHEGGMVPFEFDITDAAVNRENKIEVYVKALTVSDRMGCISQYAVHIVGGLIRKVQLFVLPATNIESIDAVTSLDKSHKKATLNIATKVAHEGSSANLTAEVEYILTDASGKQVAIAKKEVAPNHHADASLSVGNADLWNPEEPYLYTLTVKLYIDGKLVQTHVRRTGLRQIEIEGNLLLVNGQKIKLHGVNRHETHPLRGRSLTPELCRMDAELFRAANCNYIRTSHYPPSEEFLDACDELGLFVECEAALTWIQHHASPIWKKWNYKDEQFLPYMIRANVENILANRHHPSIIIWSMANESRWSPLWEKVQEAVKKLDRSRPTSFHDQCWGTFNNAGSKADIANYHYPGLNGPMACDTMKRPTLFGEYAHLSCYNREELVTDPGVRAAFGKALQQMYDSMYYHSACLGGAIWSGIDDHFHLADGRILGYGPWGPIDGWRRPKPEYTGIKKAYAPVRILKFEYSKKERAIVAEVENRYDFINLSKTSIIFDDGKTVKKIKANIAPGTKGKIILPDRTGILRITDPRGFICIEEKQGDPVPETAGEKQEYTCKVEETSNALQIRYIKNEKTHSTYVISKETGIMTHAVASDNVILTQGPVFCVVDMNNNNGGKPNVAGETYQNNIYPIKNYTLYTLFAKNVNYREEDGTIIIKTEVLYREGTTGIISYKFSKSGKINMDYIITLAEERSPRQYGMLFQLPKNMEILKWKRNGEFSIYPENDIARTEGMAMLNAKPLYEVEEWQVKPEGNWKDDANILGSVDFRSTKTQIQQASLSDGKHGISISGSEKQAIRAWLQDGYIQFLIADFNNGGSEPFYGSPFTAGRTKLKKGEVLEGAITFEIH